MNRLLRSLAVALAGLLPFAHAQTPATVSFQATNLTMGAGGASLPAGSQLCVMTTDALDRPAGYQISGGGQTSAVQGQRECHAIVAGNVSAFTAVNSAATSPANACLRVTEELSSGEVIRHDRCVQTGTAAALATWCSLSGGVMVCDYGKYPVSTAPVAQVLVGPKGDRGDPGVAGANGAAGTVTATGTNGGFDVPGPLTTESPASSAPAPLSPANIVTQDALRLHRGRFPEMLQTLADANISLNRRTFGSTNVLLAAPGYPNFYPSDAFITMLHTPKSFTAADVQGMLNLIYSVPDGSGNWPSAIAPNSTALQFYSPFLDMNGSTSPHPCRPDGDTEWVVPLGELLLYQKTGSIAHFTAHAAQIETAEANIPRDPTTGLVTVSGGCWAPWLFQELARFDGKTLTPSLFYWRVATAMSTLYTASGSTSDATRWANIAGTIKASLNASSSLWDSGHGIYNAQDGTGTNNVQPDLLGSALAASLGIATPAQASAISDYLYSNRATIFRRGYMLETLRAATQNSWGRGGDIASGACFLANHCGAGQYHNGFWSVMNYEVLNTLKINHPDFAIQYALDQVSSPGNPQLEYFNALDSGTGSDVNLESPQGTRLWAEENSGYFAGAGTTAIVSTEPLMSQGFGTSQPDYFGSLNANGTVVAVNYNHASSSIPQRDAWGSPQFIEHDNYNPLTGQNYYQAINWATGDNTVSFYNPLTGYSRDLYTVRPNGVILKSPSGNSLTAPSITGASGITASLPSGHPLTDNLFTVVLNTGSTAPAAGATLATVTFGTPFTVTIPPASPAALYPNCQLSYVDAGAPNTPQVAVYHVTPGVAISITAKDATFAPNTLYALDVSCKIF